LTKISSTNLRTSFSIFYFSFFSFLPACIEGFASISEKLLIDLIIINCSIVAAIEKVIQYKSTDGGQLTDKKPNIIGRMYINIFEFGSICVPGT